MLLLPARYEGMPNVVLEAMASKLPMVVTQVEGIADLLGDTLESQSVPREAWEAWLERVISLANNDPLSQELGRRNRDRCETHFQSTYPPGNAGADTPKQNRTK